MIPKNAVGIRLLLRHGEVELVLKSKLPVKPISWMQENVPHSSPLRRYDLQASNAGFHAPRKKLFSLSESRKDQKIKRTIHAFNDILSEEIVKDMTERDHETPLTGIGLSSSSWGAGMAEASANNTAAAAKNTRNRIVTLLPIAKSQEQSTVPGG